MVLVSSLVRTKAYLISSPHQLISNEITFAEK
jgi:hypothetical protein